MTSIYRRALIALALGVATAHSAAAGVASPAHAISAAASTSSGAVVVRPGAFCRTNDAGRTERAADGRSMRCQSAPDDARLRWREVVK